jgi:putative chitinase
LSGVQGSSSGECVTPNEISFAIGRLFSLTPHAADVYRRAFDRSAEVLPRFGIETELRLIHFCAQVFHETGGLTLVVESLSYTVERLRQVWPTRFPTIESARPYARNPRALAMKVYGGRRELGNMNAEDGWTFRGRGLPQLTGRANYTKVGAVLGLDLVSNPDLVIAPAHALEVGAYIWHLRGANVAADEDDIVKVTKAVNGGTVGLEDRKRWLAQCRAVLSEE